jgi:hypothetical protein
MDKFWYMGYIGKDKDVPLLNQTLYHKVLVMVAKHELSSLAWTPGPWVQIPPKAWMFSVCVVCAFFCVFVQVEALR